LPVNRTTITMFLCMGEHDVLMGVLHKGNRDEQTRSLALDTAATPSNCSISLTTVISELAII